MSDEQELKRRGIESPPMLVLYRSSLLIVSVSNVITKSYTVYTDKRVDLTGIPLHKFGKMRIIYIKFKKKLIIHDFFFFF